MDKAIEIGSGINSIITGDFNTFPNSPETYVAFSDDTFADARAVAQENLGGDATRVGWEYNLLMRSNTQS